MRYGIVATIMDSGDAAHLVRCVRSDAPRGGLFSRYQVDEAAGTVTDTRTGLVWQRAVHDETDWSQAKAYCDQLGDGYRLPGLNELLTLVDPTRLEPALSSLFPDIPLAGLFWSAAQSVVTEGGHMSVLVTTGQAGDHDLTLSAQGQVRLTSHVRCVR